MVSFSLYCKLARLNFCCLMKNESFVTVADVFLWRDKKLSGGILGGATVMWFLFEYLECHLLTLVAYSLIVGIAALFLWSNALAFINKYVTDFFRFFSRSDVIVSVFFVWNDSLSQLLLSGLHPRFHKFRFQRSRFYRLCQQLHLRSTGLLLSSEI